MHWRSRLTHCRQHWGQPVSSARSLLRRSLRELAQTWPSARGFSGHICRRAPRAPFFDGFTNWAPSEHPHPKTDAQPVQPPEESQDLHELWHTTGFDVNKEGKFDRRNLPVWTASCSKIAVQLRNLVASFGARLEKEKGRNLTLLEAERSGQASGSGPGDMQLRIAPKGQPTDTVEQLTWVPEEWMAIHETPEALRSFGAPPME